MGTWLGLSLLHMRLQRSAGLHGGPSCYAGSSPRITFSGAFYAISGIWFPFDPTGWDYLWHFGAMDDGVSSPDSRRCSSRTRLQDQSSTQ